MARHRCAEVFEKGSELLIEGLAHRCDPLIAEARELGAGQIEGQHRGWRLLLVHDQPQGGVQHGGRVVTVHLFSQLVIADLCLDD